MIKKKNKFFSFIIVALMLPFVMLLSGCGATPVNDVKAIYFESNLYDKETGYAVFEVDLNLTTTLIYKINPSSWSGYRPTYAVIRGGETEENRSRFKLENGNITVFNNRFEEITIRIEVNGIQDICIIRLKKYPTEISFSQESIVLEKNDYINSNGNYTIHIFGKFIEKNPETGVNVETYKELSDNEYNFFVESSNDTSINVLNSKRLKVCALKNDLSKTKVTISLLDTTGKLKADKYVLSLYLTVVLPPDSSYIKLDCYDKFITNTNNEISLDINSLDLETEIIGSSTYYKMNYTMELFSSLNVYITDEEFDIIASSNQDSFIRIDNDNKIIKVRQPSGQSELSAKLSFYATANQSSGNSYLFEFTINFIFSD